MIEGVIKTKLKQIVDERGKVMHMLRSSDDHFTGFGEVYFSWINANYVKAWKKQLEVTMNYAVPVGSIKLVLYDDREESPTYREMIEYIMSSNDYYLLTIPPGIWYGFKENNGDTAMVVNCINKPYCESKVKRLEVDNNEIAYQW